MTPSLQKHDKKILEKNTHKRLKIYTEYFKIQNTNKKQSELDGFKTFFFTVLWIYYKQYSHYEIAQVQLQSSVEMVERRGSHNNMYSARYRVIASTILPPRLLCYGYRTIVKFSLYRTSIWLIDCLFYCFTSSQQYFSHITATFTRRSDTEFTDLR